MKIRNWIVSVLAILFVFGCGGGDDSGSDSSTPPVSVTQDDEEQAENGEQQTGDEDQAQDEDVAPTGITANLVVPEDFDFKSEREVKVELSVANSQYTRGFLSVYTDIVDGEVDYNSQVIRAPVTSGKPYEGVLMLPNHKQAIWVEVWYPEDIGAVIKQQVDVIDGVASAQL
ncbi:hypothetical protein [Vibrio sp. AND4]|uniref:hypothetical protein n=1 Tax=Vibrio sp. AND4 TaxID=314289 RepID=UPI00015EFC80|nr:hypothetical protein [Vibrio sp. AND4]EDP59961.1 hypothetical protein AND4_01093 [Vibrio sp. AND4]